MIFRLSTTVLLVLSFLLFPGGADAKQEGDVPSSRYMGGPAKLVTAPNGAITNAKALKKLPKIMYLEPTTEKVAEDVMVIGHPTVNDTVEANLQGGGAPSVYGEIGPVLTARAVVQMNNFLPEEEPDARLGGVIPFGKPIGSKAVTLKKKRTRTSS